MEVGLFKSEFAIANSIIECDGKIHKKKERIKTNNNSKRIFFERQFNTYRNHLTSLLKVARDDKTHFEENEKN